MNKPFSRIVSRAQTLGMYKTMTQSKVPLLRTHLQRRFKHYQDWKKHPLNNKYIFFDFAGDLERRSPMLIPNICRFLDNYIFRSSPAYATFIVLCAYFWESCMERMKTGDQYKDSKCLCCCYHGMFSFNRSAKA